MTCTYTWYTTEFPDILRQVRVLFEGSSLRQNIDKGLVQSRPSIKSLRKPILGIEYKLKLREKGGQDLSHRRRCDTRTDTASTTFMNLLNPP